MRSILTVGCLVLFTSACATTPSLVIRNVTVIDATGAPAKPGMTVVMDGTRVMAITRNSSSNVSQATRVIDGTGKFLIPGLFDMHTHMSFGGEEALMLNVRNGVLAVRDLGGLLEELDQWRAEIDRGTRVGPRIFRAGPYVDGPRPGDAESDDVNIKLRKQTTVNVGTPEEARAAVADLKKRGVDTIKTHRSLSPETFRAVGEECHRLDLPWAAHPPTQKMTIEAVADARPTTIEHIEMLTESLSFANLKPDGKPQDPVVSLDQITDQKAMELFGRFARNGIAYDPCLVAYRSFMQEAVDNVKKDPRWERAVQGRSKMFNRFVELVGLMKRAGVTVITGTDGGTRPETVPYPISHLGVDLHDELKLFVQGGLTPMEALQSATLHPARVLRVSDRLGTIEVGKEADLLLLDADPLADISNTRKIAAVIMRGVVCDSCTPSSPSPRVRGEGARSADEGR